jgi:hypothetical protein
MKGFWIFVTEYRVFYPYFIMIAKDAGGNGDNR